MVRVQLKPNDVRSYSRQDAEKIIAQTPGAFILGERTDDQSGGSKAQVSAPNKARQGAPSKRGGAGD